MSVSARADQLHPDHLHRETFSRETIALHVQPATKDPAATTRDHASLVTVVALSLGGVLTVIWACVLVWSAGYMIGVW